MSWQRVRALMRKDILEVGKNPQAVAPVIVLPLVLVVVLPVVVLLVGANPVVTSSINGVDSFLRNLPDGVVPAGLDESQTMAYALLIYFMAPLFLMIPVLVATVTASASFVGEKEKRTIEGLLFSPLTNRELVLGKILVSLVPSVLVAWVAFVVYGVIVNALGYRVFHQVVFPTAAWLVAGLLLVPLVAFLAIGLIVAISQRATTVQGAQGIVGLLVLPIVGMMVSQAVGATLFSAPVALAAAAVLAVVDMACFLLIVRRFARESLVVQVTA
ncbi:ABC transporter permease [Xylanimonas allomyrinae]|uniref:ABC transporter permease n=1 Tax=Xylanimonas allomyrinae TaxID=2509459 RepID=A0A4P6EQJ8_9MICO|nr:ABC transporter permease subunit [Xylanimonas allomyrinae]QAY62567.1 ABC transporter permease [Xylanimonas allomyrinae]